jgi:hypothetical protein
LRLSHFLSFPPKECKNVGLKYSISVRSKFLPVRHSLAHFPTLLRNVSNWESVVKKKPPFVILQHKVFCSALTLKSPPTGFPFLLKVSGLSRRPAKRKKKKN